CFHTSHELLVSRILYQCRISAEVGRRNREQIAERLGAGSFLYVSFPGPHVAVASEFAEPYQVCAAVSFPVQFTRTLIQDKVQGEFATCDVSGSVAVCSFPDGVHIVQRLGGATALSSSQ